MLYTTIRTGVAEYKLRLTAKACVDLEKKLGRNPLNVLAEIKTTQMLPKMEDIIAIIHASLQAMEHSISIEKAYEIYDSYIDEGHTLEDWLSVVAEVFKVSGFFKEDAERKN